jgi:hypothetical protein
VKQGALAVLMAKAWRIHSVITNIHGFFLICRSLSVSRVKIAASIVLGGFKGTHARDFHSLFLNFFLHISLTYRYKTQTG